MHDARFSKFSIVQERIGPPYNDEILEDVVTTAETVRILED